MTKGFCLLVLLVTSSYCFNIGVLFPGPSNDRGLNYNLLKSTEGLKALYPHANIVYRESVTPSICLETVISLLPLDLIFFPSSAFEACALATSNLVVNGTNYGQNMSIVLQTIGYLFPNHPNIAAIVQLGVLDARFVTGVLAGHQEPEGQVCWICPKFFESKIRWANIIYNGMQYALNNKSGVELHVITTANFNDSASEARAAEYAHSNCALTIMQQNSDLIPGYLAIRNKPSIGWGADMRKFNGDQVLTSILTNWIPPFEYYTNLALTDTFSAQVFNNTLGLGIELADLSPLVSAKAGAHVKVAIHKIQKKILDPLCGAAIETSFGTECTSDVSLRGAYMPGVVEVYNA